MTDVNATDSPDGAVDPPAAVTRYREAVRAKNTAGQAIGLVVILIVLTYVFLIIHTVNSFFDDQFPEFTAAFGAEATTLMPEVADQAAAMTERLLPIYIESFAKEYANNEERFMVLLVEEFDQLDRHAVESWPQIEEAIARLVIDQEETAKQELSTILAPDDLVRVAHAYRNALEGQLEQIFTNHFEQQIRVGEDIIRKLQAIAETEPDVPADDSTYIIGMLMELLGLQMQQEPAID